MDVATILNLIDVGEYGLPEFQRGYVWSREQVRHFMSSLYHENPVGSLLIWTTNTDADVRGDVESSAGNIKLIVDGQQRITTLYGIRRGKAPPFFRGNPNSFLNLYFNLDGAKGEEFEFYGPVKMKDNPRWVSVTRVLQEGAVKVFLESGQHDELALAKLNRLEAVQKKMFHIETITGKDLDEVVDIFNMVNSGGTKLNAADLAMAKLSARWPAARDEMEARLHKWNAVGYGFDFNWLLRGVTINVTGDARFSTLSKVDPAAFEHGLRRFEKHNNELLLQIRANLGLDHGKVLRSEFSLLVLARYLELHNGLRQGEAEVAHILYWYIHTMLWGRYSASTESRLNQDLGNLRQTEFADAQIAGLTGALRSERGTLRLQELDFHGSWVGNRFYPLLYLLTRVARARDLLKNIPLSMSLIGNPLELHHLFPKTHLYKAGRNRRDVNTLANFAFLTSESNRSIGSTLPRDYFTDCERRYPGVLANRSGFRRILPCGSWTTTMPSSTHAANCSLVPPTPCWTASATGNCRSWCRYRPRLQKRTCPCDRLTSPATTRSERCRSVSCGWRHMVCREVRPGMNWSMRPVAICWQYWTLPGLMACNPVWGNPLPCSSTRMTRHAMQSSSMASAISLTCRSFNVS